MFVWPAGHFGGVAKTFDAGHYTQTFSTIFFFIPAILLGTDTKGWGLRPGGGQPLESRLSERLSSIVGTVELLPFYTIDFYHILPLSLTLNLPGVTRSAQSKSFLASFSRTLFYWSGWNSIRCWSNLSWTSWYYFGVRFNETREVIAVLLAASKNLESWHAFWRLWIDLVQTWYDDRYHFDTSLIDLDFDWGSQECEKAKTLSQFSHKGFNRFEWDVQCCCILLLWWTSHSFHFVHSIFKKENPTCVISLNKILEKKN